jgi:hypothetical protein
MRVRVMPRPTRWNLGICPWTNHEQLCITALTMAVEGSVKQDLVESRSGDGTQILGTFCLELGSTGPRRTCGSFVGDESQPC